MFSYYLYCYLQAETLPIIFSDFKDGNFVYSNGNVVEFKPNYLGICLEKDVLLYPAFDTRIGGVGILHDSVEEVFRSKIVKGGKRSGYMFDYKSKKLEIERIKPEEIGL